MTKLLPNLKLYSIVFFTALIQQVVAQAPVASFTATPVSGCPPLNVTFTNTSTGTWHVQQWSTGLSVVLDSTGVTQIQDIYPNPGTFNVCLTVTDTLTGQSNTLCQNGFITVFTPPQAAFSASNNGGCVPFTVQYTDNSVPGSSPISSWLWTLPGSSNGTYTVQSPSAAYNSAVGSPFDAALRVTLATTGLALAAAALPADFSFVAALEPQPTQEPPPQPPHQQPNSPRSHACSQQPNYQWP
jgi:PKD repeat protein